MSKTEVLIIEDETAASRNLTAILRSLNPEIEILDTIDTVEESVAWLSSHPAPDLIFMDIHLADGESFLIFDKVRVSSPIIFTTAYDQYALEAFKVSSIDYLLKPINENELRRALDKWQMLTSKEKDSYTERVDEMVRRRSEQKAFLVHFRDRIIPIEPKDIAYFYTAEEKVYIYTHSSEHYLFDQTLESISSILPQNQFIRANRQFIVSRRAIKDISVWFGSRLQITLSPEAPERIVIPKARVREFKQWLAESSK